LAARRGGRQHEPVDNLWGTCRVTCAKPGEFTVDCHRILASIPGPAWENRFHRVCKEKTWPASARSYPQVLPTGNDGTAVEKGAQHRITQRLSRMPNGHGYPLRRHRSADTRGRSDRLRRTGPACYPSRVCSIRGEAIERIAEAIDQLANDAQREGPGTNLAARVADIWLMVTALDPELARRQRRYTASTTPADGAPSP
jgi:hypothetical protein